MDVSLSEQVVTFDFSFTDNISGYDASGIELRSPTWNQYVYDYTNSLISGNSINGTYQNEITIPQYSEEGTWTVRYIYLNDKAGNTIQYATQELIDFGL